MHKNRKIYTFSLWKTRLTEILTALNITIYIQTLTRYINRHFNVRLSTQAWLTQLTRSQNVAYSIEIDIYISFEMS